MRSHCSRETLGDIAREQGVSIDEIRRENISLEGLSDDNLESCWNKIGTQEACNFSFRMPKTSQLLAIVYIILVSDF